MRFSILTLFPKMFSSYFDFSIIKRARERKKIEIEFINIRDFGIGRHKIVDDTPYGGGVGMVMKFDVLEKAIQHAKCDKKGECKELLVLLDPQGETLQQEVVRKLSKADHLILICARYEGVDERVRGLVDAEISIGDYILTGGEIPAMVIVDSVTRLLPGVLEKKDAVEYESFSDKRKILEYPQYTRPSIYKNKKVPEILLSGNHEVIKKWRAKQALKRTKIRRPDLLTK